MRSPLGSHSPARRRLILPVLALVSALRVGLWLLPYGRVRAWALGADWAGAGRAEPGTARFAQDDILWAVGAASRRVPAASCLTQALAAKRLLDRNGHDAQLRIGVARDAAGTFEAHAWLEQEGRIILGQVEGMDRFTPLPAGDDPS